MDKGIIDTRSYEVGDVVVTKDAQEEERFLITKCLPKLNGEYFATVDSYGNIQTLWVGHIKEKVDHVDLRALFDVLDFRKAKK